jgi:hypothetical protein
MEEIYSIGISMQEMQDVKPRKTIFFKIGKMLSSVHPQLRKADKSKRAATQATNEAEMAVTCRMEEV